MIKENPYRNLKVTYMELEQVLKKLNYKKEVEEDVIFFINKKFDSIIRLAKKKKNALVFPPQLSGETTILYYKGVIKKKGDLIKMILKERKLKKEKQVKATA